MTACARALDARSALLLLKDMREDGVPPNHVVINAVLDACGKVELLYVDGCICEVSHDVLVYLVLHIFP